MTTKIVWHTIHAATGELLIHPILLEWSGREEQGPDISARIVVSKLDDENPGKTVVVASLTDREGCRPTLQVKVVADLYTSAHAGRGSVQDAVSRVVAYHKTRLAKVIRRRIEKHKDDIASRDARFRRVSSIYK